MQTHRECTTLDPLQRPVCHKGVQASIHRNVLPVLTQAEPAGLTTAAPRVPHPHPPQGSCAVSLQSQSRTAAQPSAHRRKAGPGHLLGQATSTQPPAPAPSASSQPRQVT